MSVRRTIERYQEYFRSEEGKRESARVAEECRHRGITIDEYFDEVRARVKQKIARSKV